MILRVKTKAAGQSTEDARAAVLADGELGLLVDGANRYLVIGDGTRTVGAMIDADDYFVLAKDLPA